MDWEDRSCYSGHRPSIFVSQFNSTSESITSAKQPRRRAVLVRLAAATAGIFPLLVLEGGLRFFDIGRSPDSDSLSTFGRTVPLFERHGAIYRTAAARQPFFSPQEFPVTKAPRNFRIFCLGGSTVHGHPYQSATAFPKWLELELAASDSTRTYQAINCGGVSYASYRLVPIVREALTYQPDLIIVMAGENEFLEDRTFQPLKSRSSLRRWAETKANSLRLVNLSRNWLGSRSIPLHPNFEEVRARLDEVSGYASYHRDDAWQQRVAAQFEQSLRSIIRMCQEAGVPLLLTTPGCNLRDCPPFKSEHRPDLSPQEEQDWQRAFDTATAAEKSDLAFALAFYHKAEGMDENYALLAYRIARVLDRLGQRAEALAYYRRAKDFDVCPLRIIQKNEDVLRRVAAETRTHLLDAAGLLAAKSPDAIAGNDWYVDHVHPNIGGHQQIAQAIAKHMREIGLLPKTASWPETARRRTYQRHLKDLGPGYLAHGRVRVEWLEAWARRERLFEETLPNDARGCLHMGFRKFDLGDDDSAWDSFAAALKLDRGLAKTITNHAEELLAEGRPQDAARLRTWLAGNRFR